MASKSICKTLDCTAHARPALRFQIYAINRATDGIFSPIITPRFSESNFANLVPQKLDTGKVQLRNLTISVSPAATVNLQAAIASLQEQIGNLVERIDSLSAQVDEDIAALRQEQAELTEQVSSLKANLDDLRTKYSNHTHNCVVEQTIPRKGETKYVVVVAHLFRNPNPGVVRGHIRTLGLSFSLPRVKELWNSSTELFYFEIFCSCGDIAADNSS